MAKKDKGAAVEGEEEGKKKKKPIKPIIVLVLGAVGVKMFVLKSPEPTAADKLKAAKAAQTTLYNKCAEANGLPDIGDVVVGGYDPTTGKRITTTTTATPTVPTTPGTEGPIVAAPQSVTVNLVDGSYLKLGLAIQLPVGGVAKTATDDGLISKATDLALEMASEKTMKDLTDPKVRDKLKADLSFKLCMDSNAGVLKAYFTEFVMQAPSS